MRQQQAYNAILLARRNVNNGAAMQTSAEACLLDAEAQYRREAYITAWARAVKSLKYSVGIFHIDYKEAVEL